MVAENAVCYLHPDREAAVGCQRCGQAICTACMHQASVGFHCPTCTSSGRQQVSNPLRRRSTAGMPLTFGLMAVNLMAFVAQAVSSGGNGFTSGEVFSRGVLFGPAVSDGEWWRIITGGFLHASIFHIAFNMYALYIFGSVLERGVGMARMGLIYAGGLLGGSAAVLVFNWSQPTLGASGAVLGLAGGLAAVLAAQGRSIMQSSLTGILVINLALPLLIGGISFWGHAGGIAGGFVVGWLLAFLPLRMRQTEVVTRAAASGVVAALGLVAIAAGAGGPLV